MFGKGGYSSSIAFDKMAEQLDRGYAALGTDTGHTGNDPDFAIGHPEAIVDWGHRAVHESVVVAKQIVALRYDQPPRHAYFAGCSTGGHQALMEAQRYPADFDGIIAGDPGNNRTHLNAGFLWQFVKNHRPDRGAETILPATKLAMITAAAVNACHGKDGGLATDNFLTDPEVCGFQPKDLLCAGDDRPDCLTEDQVETLQAMYGGAHDPRSGAAIYYGWPKGSENSGRFVADLPGWSLYWADPGHRDRPARASFWRVWAFDDPNWDWWQFDFDAGMTTVDDKLAGTINAMNPDLTAFKAAGGKLIQYHGLADPVVPPRESIDYYERVQGKFAQDVNPRGDETKDFYRLFLVPGMEHCMGGQGPNTFDAQSALEHWVEDGSAPATIVATKYKENKPDQGVTMSRPLCPYPQIAHYTSSGDPAAAASFSCVDGARRATPLVAADYLR